MQERTGKGAPTRGGGSALLRRTERRTAGGGVGLLRTSDDGAGSRPARRPLLQSILETPCLADVVPRLPAETLHRVIDRCGLESCGALVALATPQQVEHVLDLDLWRPTDAGVDEQFDAERFGVWLEVLVEQGADVAARILAALDVDLVAAGLAQHVRVFDIATLDAYETTDGTAIPAVIEPDGGLACDLAGRRLIARRPDAWDAIVDVLAALHDTHFGAFVRLMRACAALSHSRPEADGLDNLLGRGAQSLFDLADARAQRREALGFASPADARAFLESSRRFSFHATGAAAWRPRTWRVSTSVTAIEVAAAEPGTAAAAAELLGLLREEGVLASPRALLAAAPPDQAPPVPHLRGAMEAVLARDPLLHAARHEELARLANALMAGGTLDGRAFTAREAADAAAATCNLGLECWPSQERGKPPADDLLLQHDLLTVFQVGWTVLHDDVCAHAAGALLEALSARPPHDVETEADLKALHGLLRRHWRAGAAWRAREALDVLASVDQLAWITLLGLIAECPVLPATLAVSTGSRRSIDPAAFAFIAARRQIAAIHDFLDDLPNMLSR